MYRSHFRPRNSTYSRGLWIDHINSVFTPAKRWLQPEWYYEALPFLWLALGLVLLRLPDTTALLALLPCLWGGRCLWARRRHRHHTRGLALQLRRGSGHRRGQRILR